MRLERNVNKLGKEKPVKIQPQTLVATSSTLAEYMALSDCARDCAWYKILFKELGKPIDYVPLYGDSH